MDNKSGINFIAKYGKWIAIKRMGITDLTKPEEVAYYLTSVRESIDHNARSLVGVDSEKLDAISNSIIKGMGKDVKSLSVAIEKVFDKNTDKLLDSISNKDTKNIAKFYLLDLVIKGLGFDTSISPKLLINKYPEVKKMRVLFPKKKKSKKGILTE